MQIVVAKSDHDPRWLNRVAEPFCRTLRKSAANPIAKMSEADQAEVDRLLSNQTRVTSQVRRAFLDAIKRLQDRIDIARIRDLLEAGRINEAITAVDVQLVASGMQPIAHASSAATIWAAQQAAVAANQLYAPGRLSISFGAGVTNPQTVTYLQNYEMGLIRGLTRDALASVRVAIADGVAAGRNPLDVARDVRQFIGLTESQTKAVLNYRRALENLDRNALQRGLRDARFDPTISSAIDGGTSLPTDYIDKAVERYQQRYLKYRSETIGRTEAIRAVNAGNQLLWQQAAADGKVDGDTVTRKWVVTHDGRARHAHLTIPLLNPDGVGLNEPFKSELGPIQFPGDPNASAANTINCRCAMTFRVKYQRPSAAQ